MIWVDGESSSSTSPPTTTPPSQSDSPPQPKKKKITRTRTGCQTCRDRKVKCGEERPQCVNCLRTNHVCPGYAPATVFKANRRERRSTGTTDETETATTESAPTELSLAWTPTPMDSFEDLKLLHYYTYELAHTLSLPGAIGRTWSDGVPRLAFDGEHVYLVHALLAAAAAHKVSKDPTDTQSYHRGQMHYSQSIGFLKTLDLNSCETNTSAALATVMLLIWYESLYGCWENGLLHIHGAANIVREHNTNLLKTPIGKQLFHLFARLELSASRHLLLDTQLISADGTNFFDNATFDLESLRYEDILDGTSDFEIAWTQLMKIMIPITVLRMVPRTGDRGTQERKSQGERIQEMLAGWERAVSQTFRPVPPPDTIIFLNNPITEHLEPIYYPSFNIAVAMAHHSALQVNVFTLTHRGDESRPDWFFTAVQKTLQICLGVQQLHQLGLFEIHKGGDFGILWPLIIAGIWAPEGVVRTWIQNLLLTWPREGMIDPADVRVCLDAVWSRLDLGFGFEGLYNEDPNRSIMDSDKPIHLEVSERSLSGPYKGYLRTVEIVIQDGEKMVLERPWHRGNMVLEHVRNISNKPPMVLPP